MNDDDTLITVCEECSRACCWQGEFMCDLARDANVVKKTIRELKEINTWESRGYWKTDEQLANE